MRIKQFFTLLIVLIFISGCELTDRWEKSSKDESSKKEYSVANIPMPPQKGISPIEGQNAPAVPMPNFKESK